MKLSKGIQFFAPEPETDYTVTINFDSGVESVYCQKTNDLGNTLMTWTTSGTQTFGVNWGLRYFVNLKSDYSLKTVTSNKGSIANITETTFDPIDTPPTYTLNITTEFTGTQTTYDLTNLNLSAGNYAITVVAEAEGFTDSDVSNTVAYSVGQVISDFNSTPWGTISSVSSSGQAANYWAVGDTKDVHLSGTAGVLAIDTTLKVFILEFDHNSAVEGSGISIGTFINGTVQSCFVSSTYFGFSTTPKDFAMNTSATNSGGWKSCQMRYAMLGSTDAQNGDASATTATNPVANTLMSCFPLELRSVMKPITKWSDNKGGGSGTASAVTSTIDYLPLLAEYEIQGGRSYANSAEKQHQTRYAYYTAGNPKVKYKFNDATTPASWWCRSVRASNGNFFCLVDSGGNANSNRANYSLGVTPAFLV